MVLGMLQTTPLWVLNLIVGLLVIVVTPIACCYGVILLCKSFKRSPRPDREIHIHERVLVICPFCSAKVEQGTMICPNCGGKL